MTTENTSEQIARLRREHAAMREAITDALSHLEHFAHANAQYNPDALSAHSILTDALAALNPAPAAPASEPQAGARPLLNAPEEHILNMLNQYHHIRNDYEAPELRDAVGTLKEYGFVGETFHGYLFMTEDGLAYLDNHIQPESTNTADSLNARARDAATGEEGDV